MSRILSRISMLTGQISSHALHDVHAHSSSDVMRSNTESALDRDARGRCPTGGDTTGSPVAAITSPTFSTISRGSSGLPVALAGHTEVQRPQIGAGVGVEELLPGEVLDGRGAERVELGLHQVRHGLHRALGPVLVRQVHVHRRRDHVPQLRGGQDDQEREERDEVRAPHAPVRVCERARPTSRRTATESG